MTSFLLAVVGISLSGVMAPGPITAATLAAGARSRHAGTLIALEHAIIEIPLILILCRRCWQPPRNVGGENRFRPFACVILLGFGPKFLYDAGFGIVEPMLLSTEMGQEWILP